MTRTLAWIPGSGAFGAPVDWIDQTASAMPAQAAPGTTDIVIVAGPTGGAVQVITGPGAAASLGFTGNTALIGSFSVGTLVVGGAAAFGTVDIDPGTTLSAASASLVAGGILVNGAGAVLSVNGGLGVAGSVTVQDQAALRAGNLVLDGGAVSVDAGSIAEIGGTGGAAAGVLTVDAGATLTSLGGLISEALVDNGVLLASGGVTGIFGNVTGSGRLQIGDGAALFLAGTLAAGETIAFAANSGTLLANALSGALGGVITGFVGGDVIDVSGVAVTGAAYTATGSGIGTLALSVDGVTAASVTLAGSYAGDVFVTAPDGVSGGLVMLAYGSLASGGTLSAGTTSADKYTWLGTAGGDWGTATNWVDSTAGANPAAIAPGTHDIVTIAGPTGATAEVITGKGASATLTVTGSVVLYGTYTPGFLFVGSGTTAGTLDVVAGAYINLTVMTVLPGTLQVNGTGTKFLDNGNLTLGTASSVLVLNHGSLQTNRLTLNGGTISFDSSGTFEIGQNAHAAVGVLSLDAGKTLVSTGGVINGAVVDNSTIFLNSGMTIIGGAITGAGTLQIAAGAMLLAGSTVAATDTIAFAAATGSLILDGGTGSVVAGDITGFAAGDVIDIIGAVLAGASFTASGTSGGTLALTTGGTTAMSLVLAGNYAGDLFQTGSDGQGGTIVTFVAGTLAMGGTLSAGSTGNKYSWLAPRSGNWDAAANWQDVTSGADPALVAPGSNDSVTITGAAGVAVQVITGPGDAASLAITGTVALAGSFAVGTLTIGTAGMVGALEVDAGATLVAASASLVAGFMQVSGTGAGLSVGGTLTLGAALSVLNQANVQAGGLVLIGGTLALDGVSSIELGDQDDPAVGMLVVDAGATLTSSGGVIHPAIALDGVLEASGGVTSLLGAISGGGVLRIDAGATLFVPGAVGTAESVVFTGGSGTLLLYPASGGFAGGISGFVAGDAIDVAGVVLTGASYAAIGGDAGTLTLTANGTVVLSLDLAGNYAGTVFHTASDGGGGTLVMLAPGVGGALSEGTSTSDQYRWLGQIGGDWGTASNWADSTSGADPALIAPGSNDAAVIAGPTGAAMQIVTGQGRSASLTMTGDTTLAGQFTTGTLAVGAAATLDVAAGATLAVASASVGAGAVVSALNQAVVQVGGLVLEGGTLAVDGSSSMEIGADGSAAVGELTVDAGATLDGDGGTIDAGLMDDGLLEAAGSLSIEDDIAGRGTLLIEAGATLTIAGAMAAGVGVDFGGAAGTLLLSSVANPFAGVIGGLLRGDVIDVANEVLSGTTYEPDTDGPDTGTLTLLAGGQPVLSLELAGNYATTSFPVVSDDNGGTDVSVPCYAAGTRILTPSGEVAVEALRVGDAVVTLPRRGGRVKRVIWIGRRKIDLVGRAQRLRPVRIRRGSFAPGQPHRDLLLSPEHAVYVDEALVPIHLLCNGATIARAWDVDAITYWHVELDCHDVMFAEGLPAESYLDTGNRGDFGDPVATRRDASPQSLRVWEEQGCATLVMEGPRLAAARHRLAARAASLGWGMTDDPALHLWAGAREIAPMIEGDRYVFVLPAGSGGLRLVSRGVVPAEIDPDNPDHRRLGVAVRRIVLDGRALSLLDPALRDGWHAPEAGGAWRWTNGDIRLACGARYLEITLAPILRYWTADAPALMGQAHLVPQPCDLWCGAALAHAAQIVLEESRRWD